MKQSAIKTFHRGAGMPKRSVPRPDLTRLDSLSSGLAVPPELCPGCGGGTWDYETTGDGGVVQWCTRCHSVFPSGRFWVDRDVGPRSESNWSSLRTRGTP